MSLADRPRVAVVLFNLGGPDQLSSVRPFLFNLFNDQAIISLPQPLRWFLAQLISRLREKTAIEIYKNMGGSSPLGVETRAQSEALERALGERLGSEVKTFVAMRYWKPFTADAVKAVQAFNPTNIVLMPLYPQFSTTTTGSSYAAWRRLYKGEAKVHLVCCYPEEDGFISAHRERILATLEGRDVNDVRIIFSAHGLPEQVITRGDPYQDQVERTVRRLAAELGSSDWRVSYQSRVGPLKWIGPSTIDVLEEAGRERRPVLVVPIAFVSEHSETLVELDLEYSELAKEAGVPLYLRAPAIGASAPYIKSLAEMAAGALETIGPRPCGRVCDRAFGQCPYLRSTAEA